MAELVAAQGAGALVRRLVEAAGGSSGVPAESCEAALYDCAVVVYNLAGAGASACPTLQRDLVGEGGVLPALVTLAGVRCVCVFSRECLNGFLCFCVFVFCFFEWGERGATTCLLYVQQRQWYSHIGVRYSIYRRYNSRSLSAIVDEVVFGV